MLFRTKQKYRLFHETLYLKIFSYVRLLCERTSKRTYSVNGCAMAQAVTRWPLTSATRLRSLVKSDTRKGVSLSNPVFPCQYDSNNAQNSSSKLFLTKGQRGKSWGPSNERNALPEISEHQEREWRYSCRLHILAATVTADADVLGTYVLLNDVARQFHNWRHLSAIKGNYIFFDQSTVYTCI